MKSLLLSFFCLSFLTGALAQKNERKLTFRTIGRDSVNIFLNDDYYLIEDTCATITRYGHFNLTNNTFYGKFKDVSMIDPSVILSEGNYTDDGLKNGLFISRYINGNIRSKGSYKNDQFDGKWELNYENGKPHIIFQCDSGNIKILDLWNAKGIQIVEKGKGDFDGFSNWRGKLNNGSPDGVWKAADVFDRNKTIATEDFKKGEFQNGRSPIGEKYNGASRIVLIDKWIFPYMRAEKLTASSYPCGNSGSARKVIRYAEFYNGSDYLGQSINDLVNPYLSNVDIKSYKNTVDLLCTITTKGYIGNVDVKSETLYDETIIRGLAYALKKLPSFKPATIDSKPVTQILDIAFVFDHGLQEKKYRYCPTK